MKHLPLINAIVALPGKPDLYRVSYINSGKQRITLEYVGTRVHGPEDSIGSVQLQSGSILSGDAFSAYCADRWPVEQPKRTTLNVQNGVLGASGGL